MNNLPDTRHQTPDTNRVKDGILLIIVCTCITCFLWSCEHNFDELATDENGEINYHIEAETASILEAKALFHSKKHRDALPLKKQSSDLEINPDWNSVGYHQISYTEALLGKADVNVNRKGSYYSELLFIKHKGVVKSVIFTVWPANFNENGDILDAKVYINDLDGSFLDGYRIEGGKFTKRFVLNQAKVHSAGLFMFLFQQDDDCWNTDTLDLYPGGVLDEVTLHASTDENGNAQGGSATGYIGYYSIINGAATDGSSTTGSGSTDANGITDTEMTSAAGTIITLPPEGCPPGQVKNANDECVTPCNTSKEDLKKVFPNTSDTKLQEIVDAINKYAKDFGIDTKEKLQHFLAQAGHESNEFKAFSEYTNFRVNRLHIIFGKHFNPYDNPTKDSEKQNPKDYEVDGSVYAKAEKLYNFVYDDANRGKKYKLGNTSPGDGYKYRGRGIFQLTGKKNYNDFNTYYQENYDSNTNLVTSPDLIATNTDIAVISALWYYDKRVAININSDTTVREVTEEVNGGDNGIDDRKNKFNKAKENIDCL